jgi:cell division protein FtsQ
MIKWHNILVRKIGNTLLWCGVAVVLVFISSAAISSQQKRHITDVVFDLNHLSDGNDLITLEEIKEKVLKTYEFELDELNTDHIDLEDIERLLRDEAFIEDARTYIDSKQRLHIDIFQRTPILRVINLNGEAYYLGEDGTKLPLSEHFTARVPIITGYAPKYTPDFLEKDNLLNQVHHVVTYARDDPFLKSWLEGVHIDQNGEMTLLGNFGSFKVHLGDDKDLDEKIAKMKIFFKKGLNEMGWRHIDAIHLAFENQVVTKLKR